MEVVLIIGGVVSQRVSIPAEVDITTLIGDWRLASTYDAVVWRNETLSSTDWIVPVTDHSSHAQYLTYRQALRDWPSTSDFPDTKPTL